MHKGANPSAPVGTRRCGVCRFANRRGRIAGPLLTFLAVALAAGAIGAAISRVRTSHRARPHAVQPTAPLPADAGARIVPGILSVTDALQADTLWIVLDRRSPALHWLDERGAVVRSVGAAGQGPGELRRPRALARLGDTLVVASSDGARLDYFSLTGQFLRRTPLDAADCTGGTLIDMVGAPAPTLFVLRQCIDVPRAWVRVQLVAVAPQGWTREIAAADLYDIRGRAGNAFAIPVLAASAQRIYFGAGTPCLQVFDVAGRTAGELCYPVRERVPMPPELRRQIQEKTHSRPLLSGPAYQVPEHLPPFDAVFPAGERLIWRVFTGQETRALDVWTPDQPEPQRLPIQATEFTFVGPSSVLVARELLGGIAIAIIPLRLD